MSDRDEKGRIFDIQRFSVHDGPGIRTLVFLKGCIFRCQWCCNPESQNFEVETMQFGGKDKVIGREVTVGEVMAEIEKDRTYYNKSGGGVTLSGGECLCQPNFVKALFKTCHEAGITTAIETTAGVKQSVLEDVLPFIDLVMMDIKHMDAEKHKHFTGRDNVQILSNARYLAAHAKELIIRVPVIPGVNDSHAAIEAIARYVKDLRTVKELHLLPYHRMGMDKYTGLGRSYNLTEILPPSEGEMTQLLAIVQKHGLKGQIGG